MSEHQNPYPSGYVKVAKLENEFEAPLIESELRAREVSHALKSYHDPVYDGVFQHHRGRVHLEVPAEFQAEIEQMGESGIVGFLRRVPFGCRGAVLSWGGAGGRLSFANVFSLVLLRLEASFYVSRFTTHGLSAGGATAAPAKEYS